MIDIESLVRPDIRSLKPYRSARDSHSTGLLLDANENSFGSAISFDGLALHRYPDPRQIELRTQLAEMNNVALENIFVGVGSDEAIDLLIRVYCEPKVDSIMIFEPTYAMYRIVANVQGVFVKSCLMTDDFQIDLTDAIKSLTKSTKIIFCCSPNNPTGNLLQRRRILELCKKAPSIVVVDEAYIDFSNSATLLSHLRSFSNLVVLRTFSKAWGLAGIRLGYCVANAQIVSYLMKVKKPYNVNSLTAGFALQALKRKELVRRRAEEIINQRKELADELRRLQDVDIVFPSDANFLLVRFVDAKSIYEYLALQGIIVRDVSSEPLLENCLRITVGTRRENETLLKALQRVAA